MLPGNRPVCLASFFENKSDHLCIYITDTTPSTPSINFRSKPTQRCTELLAKCNICSGLSTQHVNNTRRINNFVGAVEAATDIKKENLAIERKLARGSAAEDSPDLEPDLAERKRSALASYLKIAVPWLLFIVILCVIAYFIISSSVAT